MLFGNMIKNTSVQGDIRISVWEDGEEKIVQYYRNVEDMKCEPCRLFAYHRVKYIFAQGDGVLHIELEPMR